jgi:glycosyltransferase involved in cell wall biosynthesis
VTAIHLGAEQLPDESREKAARPYILFVGTLEARKNLVTLIKGFTTLRESDRIGQRLVLAGQQGYGWQEISKAIQSSSFRHEIEVLGYKTRPEILRLYRSADLLVFPSLYEGFGLPLLEAMACGTPVACSRAASLPEVAGDAAEYFDPASSEDLARAIERVLVSPEHQESLRRKGQERLKQFSWEECARRHCQVFREVLQV